MLLGDRVRRVCLLWDGSLTVSQLGVILKGSCVVRFEVTCLVSSENLGISRMREGDVFIRVCPAVHRGGPNPMWLQNREK